MIIAGTNSSGSANVKRIRLDLQARRMDSFTYSFTITYYDSDNLLHEVDLTDAWVQMGIKRSKQDKKVLKYMDTAISGNELTISKDREEMDLPTGRYWYDIEVQDAQGKHITWVEGRFIMVEHITDWIDGILDAISIPFKTIIKMAEGIWLKPILSFRNTVLFHMGVSQRLKLWFAVKVKLSTLPFVKQTSRLLFDVSIKYLKSFWYKTRIGFTVAVEFSRYKSFYGSSKFSNIIYFETKAL